jgi:negative modulator of initiation of replication
MKMIAVEPDVCEYVLNEVAMSGESPTDFLRRRLGIRSKPGAPSITATSSLLDDVFKSPEFRHAKGVVGRFLVLLGWLYRNHQKDFAKVENIKGRGRLYFARSERELHEAGRSVNPKQIPGSPFWVITTSPTDLKQDMIGSVMKILGYSQPEILRARSEIAREAERQRILESL